MRSIKNQEVASVLERIADLLEMKGGNRYRVRAYREAARRIERLSEDVETMAAEERLLEIRGVGESIAGRILEYLETGHCGYLEALEREVVPGFSELLKVPGLGSNRAEVIFRQLGVRTIEGLTRAAREHRLSGLADMDKETEEGILREVERLRLRTRRALLAVALPMAEQIVELLRERTGVFPITAAGSVRRGLETVGDVDILAGSAQPGPIIEAVTGLPMFREVLVRDQARISVVTRGNLQVDVRVVPPHEWGAALLHFTGSEAHDRALRAAALRQGLELDEHGLYEAQTGRRLAGEDEAEIYRLLTMQYPSPELRENQGEIEAALAQMLPALVTERDLRGDLHVHTDWSDGADSLESMVRAARDRGYDYVAITDHSQGLAIARGLSVERVRQQRRIIDRLNEQHAPFRVLHGTECNVLSDGSLDYDEEILRQFDIVTAAVHSGFDQPRQKITSRIVRALRNPFVDVLSHPSGRRIGLRPGYDVEMQEVIRVAAETGTALEIDSQPDRLDLNDVWAHRAREAGALLSIDSDAHSVEQLGHVRYGLLTARRGWIEKRDVLNTLTLGALLRMLRRRRRAA